MKSLLLIIVPLAAAVVAALLADNRTRPWLLPVVGVHPHAADVLAVFRSAAGRARTPGWASIRWRARCCRRCRCCSSSARSMAFPICRCAAERHNRVFVAALLAVLGLLSAGHQARHLGLLWIFTEGVTLAAVPLLHFNGTPRAFEATWKYLLVGGTGIALSLFGSFCLGYASLHGGGKGDLTLSR